MVLPTVLILLLSWAAGLEGETRPRAAAERRSGRAQRRGAGPRRARVRVSPQLLSALSARLSRPRAALPAGALLSLARPDRAPAGSGPGRLRSPGPGLPRPHGPAALPARLLQPLCREPRSQGGPPSRAPQPPQPCPGPSPGPRRLAATCEVGSAARALFCKRASGRSWSGPGPGVGRRCACPTRAPSLRIVLFS